MKSAECAVLWAKTIHVNLNLSSKNKMAGAGGGTEWTGRKTGKETSGETPTH